jgi:hypothetical protein
MIFVERAKTQISHPPNQRIHRTVVDEIARAMEGTPSVDAATVEDGKVVAGEEPQNLQS